jgi:NAD(P)-dependent dehydrogenase (short-subunit alcohol dehydrogenase family)
MARRWSSTWPDAPSSSHRARALADEEGLDLEQAEHAILERRGIAHARWGTAEEIADVVVFLPSHAARFVNGTVLRADGGQAPAVDYRRPSMSGSLTCW